MQEVNSKPEEWIDTELAKQRAAHLERSIHVYDGVGGAFTAQGRRWLNFGSNDYLDFARHPRLKKASVLAVEQYGTGATSSRLITGTLPPHDALERRIARHKGYPAAVVFGSGYMTNAGVISALIGRNDHAFADRLIHASVIDAERLSGAKLHRFAHNDPESLAQTLQRAPSGHRLILTESVFSMDGDQAPLEAIAALAESHEALLMVDEAHAGGVFGPHGAGLVSALNLQTKVTASMGTLSKALGGYGGYTACSERMRQWLINRSRAFIYTTALPPAVMAAALESLRILEETPGLGKTLLARAQRFRERLQDAGLDTLRSSSQIVPVLVRDNAHTLRLAERLKSKGILVGALRPPTVPPDRARLRFSITLAHSDEDLDRAFAAVIDAFKEERLL